EPLRAPFIVDLVLVGAAGIALALTPETVERRRWRIRFQRLSVPAEIRGVFVRGATVAFASSAVAGLFGAVAPALLEQAPGAPRTDRGGGLVFILFWSSVAGQLAVNRLSDRQALVWGCAVTIAGVGLIALALIVDSLALLIVSAAVVGVGQGLAIGAGLAAI